ncbi:MAG: lipopolysaccharide assembly protein LapB [Pseudomonadales bacterium]
MSDPTLFLILFVAVAIGYALGRFARQSTPPKQVKPALNKHYVAGVNFLLNDQPDGAIDAFISSLAVNSETIETHLAIGKLSRKQGETDRAIRVHQNLLARPSLSKEQRQLVQYELALDYNKAGWLDRAERILQDLLEQAAVQRKDILRTLLDIYEQEREWALALPLARELVSITAPKIARRYSVAAGHYCCEIAQLAQSEQRFNDSLKDLKSALQYDKKSVRASILMARSHLALGKPKKALSMLRKMQEQDLSTYVEGLPELRLAFDALGNEAGLLKLLESSLQKDSPTPLVLAVFEEMEQQQGVTAALEFLEQRFHDRTSLRGLSKMLEHNAALIEEGPMAEVVNKVHEVLSIELAERPKFSCGHCGFQGEQQHWRCPGCKTWGSVNRL